jgi:hypothetical protein
MRLPVKRMPAAVKCMTVSCQNRACFRVRLDSRHPDGSGYRIAEVSVCEKCVVVLRKSPSTISIKRIV